MKNIFSKIPVSKIMAVGLLSSALLLPLTARAEIKAGSVEVSPFAGFNFFEKRQNLEDRPVFGGRLGYNITNHFGIEGTVQTIKSRVDDNSAQFSREGQFTSPIDDVRLTSYHLDLLYHFLPAGKFNPFILGGYGIGHYNPAINNKNMSVIDFGVGAKYWMWEHVALRVDVRDNMVLDDTVHNVETTLGVVFAFGGKGKTAAAAVQPEDSDRDGVADTLDKCPGTPAGIAVDSDGCPRDSDEDGVSDTLDKCPGTPAGVAVGTDGCPLDSDKDGVVDYLDKCSGTPAGVKVDAHGCPVDTDKDGVADYLDKCPNTPAGVAVDGRGCPVVVVSPEKKAAAARRFCSTPAVLAINFDTDKTDIKHHYHDELKTVGDFLTYFPNAKGEIAGHADVVGTKEHNLILSQARADNVKNYIVETFGIDAARIDTKGYGFSKPVASNKTVAGRAKNRRIEANFTCD